MFFLGFLGFGFVRVFMGFLGFPIFCGVPFVFQQSTTLFFKIIYMVAERLNLLYKFFRGSGYDIASSDIVYL